MHYSFAHPMQLPISRFDPHIISSDFCQDCLVWRLLNHWMVSAIICSRPSYGSAHFRGQGTQKLTVSTVFMQHITLDIVFEAMKVHFRPSSPLQAPHVQAQFYTRMGRVAIDPAQMRHYDWQHVLLFPSGDAKETAGLTAGTPSFKSVAGSSHQVLQGSNVLKARNTARDQGTPIAGKTAQPPASVGPGKRQTTGFKVPRTKRKFQTPATTASPIWSSLHMCVQITAFCHPRS